MIGASDARVTVTAADMDAAASASGYKTWREFWEGAGNAFAQSQARAFARHRQSATAPLLAALEQAGEALARLAYWFDPDTETLAAMDVDTLADHKRQVALIKAALATITAELAKHKGRAMREIHNAIGDFHFDEPDFDECGGRTFRRVMVPKAVVRKIVEATLAVHETRRALARHAEHTADSAGKGVMTPTERRDWWRFVESVEQFLKDMTPDDGRKRGEWN